MQLLYKSTFRHTPATKKKKMGGRLDAEKKKKEELIMILIPIFLFSPYPVFETLSGLPESPR